MTIKVTSWSISLNLFNQFRTDSYPICAINFLFGLVDLLLARVMKLT